MHIMIIGAAGMIGRKLTQKLLNEGALRGESITKITLVDVVPMATPTHASIEMLPIVSDLSRAGQAAHLIQARPDVIFHLAAIVSGEAEVNFTKGYHINLDGTRHLLEAIRLEGERQSYCPRLVFTSSIAVFGQPLPDTVPDDFALSPLTSYGTQKAICELLLADYSRRHFVDAIALRLPTICVRPGKPNTAASSFFSGIIREPLAGQQAILPVSRQLRHWFASPRAAILALIHAATIHLESLGARRSLDLPGVSASIEEQIEALRHIAGENAVKLIREQRDPLIERIVASWPKSFTATRAQQLGFRAESSMEEIIRVYMQDDMPAIVA